MVSVQLLCLVLVSYFTTYSTAQDCRDGPLNINNNNNIHGVNCQVTGNNNAINGDYANVKGNNNGVTGNNAIVTGNQANINGDSSEVYGNNANIVGRDKAKVVGNNPSIKSNNAFVEGHNADITGDNADVTGNNPRITGGDATVRGNNANVDGIRAKVTGRNPKVTGNDAVICSEIGNKMEVTGDDIDIKVIFKYPNGRPSPLSPGSYDNRVIVDGMNAKVNSQGGSCMLDPPTVREYDVQVTGKRLVVKIDGRVVQSTGVNQDGNNLVSNLSSGGVLKSSSNFNTVIISFVFCIIIFLSK